MKKYFFTRTKKPVAIFLALIFLGLLPGCRFYFKVQTVKKVSYKEIKKYYTLNKYFILHQGDSAWNLSFPRVTDSIISGNLVVLPDYHWKFKTTKTHGGNRYKNTRKHDESFVLSEVHLYLQDSIFPKINSGDSIKLAYSTIGKAEVYKKAKGRTTASWLIPALGGPILAVGILAIVIAADIQGGGIGANVSF